MYIERDLRPPAEPEFGISLLYREIFSGARAHTRKWVICMLIVTGVFFFSKRRMRGGGAWCSVCLLAQIGWKACAAKCFQAVGKLC